MPQMNWVGFLRTARWAKRLARRTGLKPDQLEERLAQLRNPGKEFGDPTGLMRRYVGGKRRAALAMEHDREVSIVLLAEELAPNSYWDFCEPFFDLLEEVLCWRKPHLASQRFAKRVKYEIWATWRARHLEALEDGKKAADIAESKAAVALTYTRLKRIRRAMLAIECFPIERFFCFSSRNSPGYVRRMSPPESEVAVICFPPTLRDLTIALALHLEAEELMDPLRCATTAELLLTALPALRSDETLRTEAERVCKLIYQELFSLDDLKLPLEHFRLARTMASMSGQELMSEPELLRAVAAHQDAIRMALPFPEAAYVLA